MKLIDLTVPLGIATPPWPTYEPLQCRRHYTLFLLRREYLSILDSLLFCFRPFEREKMDR